MGKVNDQLNFVLSKPSRLADFFNAIIYDGQRVILPQDLADIQKCYHEPLPERYGKRKVSRRERDVSKLLLRNGHCILLAVENQNQISYCMPLRCAEYDLTDLIRQLRRLKRHYRKTKELKGSAEYLSGMKATDRLIPSITILLYHGKDKWTAATQLSEILDLEGMDESLQKYLGNYQLHVVNLTDLDENKFTTDLREVVGIAKCRGNKDALRKYCRDNSDRLRSLDEDTYDLICALLNQKSLDFKKENYYNAEKEEIDMCKAMEDWAKDEQEKGRKEGRKEGEEQLSSLIQRLAKDGRMDDILKAAKSVRVRRRLYQEYSI